MIYNVQTYDVDGTEYSIAYNNVIMKYIPYLGNVIPLCDVGFISVDAAKMFLAENIKNVSKQVIEDANQILTILGDDYRNLEIYNTEANKV